VGVATRTGSNNKCMVGTTTSVGLDKGQCDALAATMRVGGDDEGGHDYKGRWRK
jgi:hypothetical protein